MHDVYTWIWHTGSRISTWCKGFLPQACSRRVQIFSDSINWLFQDLAHFLQTPFPSELVFLVQTVSQLAGVKSKIEGEKSMKNPNEAGAPNKILLHLSQPFATMRNWGGACALINWREGVARNWLPSFGYIVLLFDGDGKSRRSSLFVHIHSVYSVHITYVYIYYLMYLHCGGTNRAMENKPVVDVVPIGKGRFWLLCQFTGGYIHVYTFVYSNINM